MSSATQQSFVPLSLPLILAAQRAGEPIWVVLLKVNARDRFCWSRWGGRTRTVCWWREKVAAGESQQGAALRETVRAAVGPSWGLAWLFFQCLTGRHQEAGYWEVCWFAPSLWYLKPEGYIARLNPQNGESACLSAQSCFLSAHFVRFGNLDSNADKQGSSEGKLFNKNINRREMYNNDLDGTMTWGQGEITTSWWRTTETQGFFKGQRNNGKINERKKETADDN